MFHTKWHHSPVTRLLASLALALAVQTSIAVPIETGLWTQTNLRQCSSESACIGGDPSLEFASDTDFGETGSVSTRVLGETDGTQAATSAGFSGDAYTPTISSYAFTTGPVRYTLSSFGLQRYEFVDDGQITIGGNLTFSQSGQTDPRAENPRGVMGALFMAFQMESNAFDPENCNFYRNVSGVGAPNEAGAISSCLRFNGQDIFGDTVEFDGLRNYQESVFDIGRDPVSAGELSRSLTVSGLAGDVFFLATSLGGGAHLGGFYDSRTTLRIDFDRPDRVSAAYQNDTFQPAPAPIPEPAGLALLATGLLTLVAVRRRRGR